MPVKEKVVHLRLMVLSDVEVLEMHHVRRGRFLEGCGQNASG